jgi:hypothetical protein
MNIQQNTLLPCTLTKCSTKVDGGRVQYFLCTLALIGAIIKHEYV